MNELSDPELEGYMTEGSYDCNQIHTSNYHPIFNGMKPHSWFSNEIWDYLTTFNQEFLDEFDAQVQIDFHYGEITDRVNWFNEEKLFSNPHTEVDPSYKDVSTKLHLFVLKTDINNQKMINTEWSRLQTVAYGFKEIATRLLYKKYTELKDLRNYFRRCFQLSPKNI